MSIPVFFIQTMSIILPISLCILNKNKQQKTQKLSIKQIVNQCLIKIKKHQKAIQSICVLKKQQKILEPFQYVRNIGGKKIRLCMAVLLSQMFTEKLDQIVLKIGALIQYLHTASLIIDDIQDGSILRRQQPCSHLVYGLDRSINAANLVYFLPFNNLLSSFHSQNDKLRIINAFTQQMITSHLGQAQDVLVHKLTKKQDLPSIQQYYRLISAKTSSLLRMMAKMVAVVVGISQENQEIFVKVMNYVGISFQITDDVLNLSRGMGKGIVAEDLHQKKFTIIVHFLRNHQQFMEEFIHPKKSEQSIKRMLDIIQAEKVIPKCKQIAHQFSQKALKQVQNIKSPYSKDKFIKLIEFIIQRDR